MKRTTCAVLVLAGLVMSPVNTAGHEIPNDVTVQVVVKPVDGRLVVLVRVPLRAMRDVRFPLRGPGYLAVGDADESLRNAAMLWIANDIDLFEGDARLEQYELIAARASIPSDRSFQTYETALAHVLGSRLPETTNLHWQNALLDIALAYPIGSAASRFSMHPRLERLALRVVTVLRFVTETGGIRAFQYVGNPGMVRLDPSWYQAAFTFASSGFFHILDGVDHLLFLLCLVIPLRNFRALIPVVTAFTVGHSITLIASAFGVAPNALWFPPLVETLIAVSIVYMAIENIIGPKAQRRWIIAFGFGLVHGFGFSFALRESLQFAGSHLLASLLSFNLGVEVGQIAALAVLVPGLVLLFRFGVREKIGVIILSALVAHTGWHWMTARGAVLSQYQIDLPPAQTLALVGLRWLFLIVLLAAGAWLAARVYRTVSRASGGDGTDAEAEGRPA